jgi:hypothetical protein
MWKTPLYWNSPIIYAPIAIQINDLRLRTNFS